MWFFKSMVTLISFTLLILLWLINSVGRTIQRVIDHIYIVFLSGFGEGGNSKCVGLTQGGDLPQRVTFFAIAIVYTNGRDCLQFW